MMLALVRECAVVVRAITFVVGGANVLISVNSALNNSFPTQFDKMSIHNMSFLHMKQF